MTKPLTPSGTVTRSRADFLIGIMAKLIEAYQGVGMHHAAIGFYNTALQLFPEIEESPRMVNLHEILGDWQKALDSMLALTEKDPVDVYEQLKDVLLHNKNHFENSDWLRCLTWDSYQ